MSRVHEYRAKLQWSGSTAGGTGQYQREHRASCPPASAGLRLSSDPAFGGDPDLLNPEQLLLLAASSCQMLTFLWLAARAGIDVVSYRDDAGAVMPENDRPVRITKITLRPHIILATATDNAGARRLITRAHQDCFIANSLGSEILIEPQIEIRAAARGDDG